MKIKQLSVLKSRILFLSISLFVFLCGVKSSFADNNSGWTLGRESTVDRVIDVLQYGLIANFLITPLVVLGILFYLYYLYSKIVKKNEDQAQRSLIIGTIGLSLAVVVYLLLIGLLIFTERMYLGYSSFKVIFDFLYIFLILPMFLMDLWYYARCLYLEFTGKNIQEAKTIFYHGFKSVIYTAIAFLVSIIFADMYNNGEGIAVFLVYFSLFLGSIFFIYSVYLRKIKKDAGRALQFSKLGTKSFIFSLVVFIGYFLLLTIALNIGLR